MNAVLLISRIAYINVRKTVVHVIKGHWTRDGAGVRLYRVFGDPQIAEITDPFLLLDHFGSRNPDDYIMGFPWHPHRGIETVTYLLNGEVHHRDSTGNEGVIGPGDVQWMTAGSGIFHEEMPKPIKRITLNGDEVYDTEVNGFQLWINLPSRYKMKIPKYRNVLRKHIPIVELDNGGRAVIIAGRIRASSYGVIEGPVNDLTIPIHYLDIQLPEESTFNYEVSDGYTALIYMIDGEAHLDQWHSARRGELIILTRDGDEITIRTDKKPARFLLMAGKPIEEPIAWYGPIVMNTWDEIRRAFNELRRGTFIKAKPEIQDY